MQVSWEDIRFALAVARRGSTLAAARELGVSQSTVARKVDQLELALAARLFARRRGGYRLTAAGVRALPAWEGVERAVEEVTALFPAQRRKSQRRLRISAPAFLARHFLMPLLEGLTEPGEEALWEMIVGPEPADIANGEADLAFGLDGPPTDPGLIIRRLAGEVEWGVFCSTGYEDDRGAPTSWEALADHRVLAPREMMDLAPIAWLARSPGQIERAGLSTLDRLAMAVRRGGGVSVLPRMAERDADLILCLCAPSAPLSRDMWAVYHGNRKNDPQLRAVMNAVAAALRRPAARPHPAHSPTSFSKGLN